ncbi:MAG: hypothetical protein NT074_02570 [Methanomicrobiales archaeon]|jgi:uncharacterized protein YkwD|nr:hypothetical protein [Methanomicrobiales archaeon]
MRRGIYSTVSVVVICSALIVGIYAATVTEGSGVLVTVTNPGDSQGVPAQIGVGARYTAKLSGVGVKDDSVTVISNWERGSKSITVSKGSTVTITGYVLVTGHSGSFFVISPKDVYNFIIPKNQNKYFTITQKCDQTGNFKLQFGVNIPGTLIRDQRILKIIVGSPTPTPTPTPTTTPTTTHPVVVPLNTNQIEKYAYDKTNAIRGTFQLTGYWRDGIDHVCHAWMPDADGVQITAREHSADMADNNYFAHNSLNGKTPYQRIRETLQNCPLPGTLPTAYAENIAWTTHNPGDTEQIVAERMINAFVYDDAASSWGHRHNILDGQTSDIYSGWHNPALGYNKMGIGVAVGYNYQGQNGPVYILTQDFYNGGCGCR